MSNPTVSIGLPVYNGENFVAEAISSLLAQSFEDLELIISDNGSSDGTAEICRDFASRDKRVHYHRSDVNRGARWNFPHVFHLARGRYFKWAAHDDVCAPTLLERCVSALESDASAVLCMPRTAVIDEASHRIEQDGFTSGCQTEDEERERLRCLTSTRGWERYLGVLLHSLRCYEVFALIRTDAMRNSGLYRGYNGSEKVFLAEISLMGRFIEHPETLFYSRWHDSRFSSNPSGTGQNQLVDPTSSRRFAVPHELQCGLGYLLLLAARDVALTDRIGGLAAWIRFVMRPSKWRVIMNKLFTGRSNTVSLAPQVAAAEKVAIGEAAACD